MQERNFRVYLLARSASKKVEGLVKGLSGGAWVPIPLDKEQKVERGGGYRRISIILRRKEGEKGGGKKSARWCGEVAFRRRLGEKREHFIKRGNFVHRRAFEGKSNGKGGGVRPGGVSKKIT